MASAASQPAQAPSPGLEVIRVGAACSQRSLDSAVRAAYGKSIQIGPGNAAELLAAADYLQASWLTAAILEHVRSGITVHNALAIFDLGRQYPEAELQEEAASFIARHGDKQLGLALLASSPQNAVSEQLRVLKSFSACLSLSQVLDLLEISSAHRGWRLRENHIKLLMGHYPASHRALSSLLLPTSTRQEPLLSERTLRLLSMYVSAEDVSTSIEWRVPVSELRRHQPDETTILLSPCTLLLDGMRRFELQLQLVDGKWGIFVNAVNTSWQRGDAFDVINLAKPDLKYSIKWMSFMSEGNSFGIRKSFDWLDDSRKLLNGGTVLGIGLVRRSKQ